MMVKRPRCRSCERRIWPWQSSGGWAVVGEPDNGGLSWLRHLACVRRDRAAEHMRQVRARATARENQARRSGPGPGQQVEPYNPFDRSDPRTRRITAADERLLSTPAPPLTIIVPVEIRD
jgi:hypothetical protein